MDPKVKVLSLLDEFKKFALKGNVIDMAIGIIIGTAFTKVIDALVKSVMMPLLSVILPGEHGWASWHVEVWGVDVPYGVFVAEVINFLILAFALYIFTVKFLGWILRLRKQEEAAPPPPPEEVKLLTEIRDILKAKEPPLAA